MEKTNSSWEEETKIRIDEAKQKQQYHENEAKFWREYSEALSKALSMQNQPKSARSDIEQNIFVNKIKNQPVRTTLIQIAQANSGVLVVNDAVTRLVEARLFNARNNARNAIYSNIYNNRKYFEKDKPGIYRLINTQNIMLPLNA
jgi:hypothetical protein